MAYIDAELRNIRLVWSTIGDRVLVIGLIMAGMFCASVIAAYLGHPPSDLRLMP